MSSAEAKMINLLKSSHNEITSFQERVSSRDRKKEEERRDDRTQQLDKYRERRDIRERDKDPKEHKKEKQRDQKERESMKEKEDNNNAALDETTVLHEVAIGKGLSGALNLLKDRGALKQSSSTTSTAEWGVGRKLEVENNGVGRRTDEYGRILTPKQEFRLFCHKFHGKGPGKKKQDKRILQYQEELKVKHMENSDTPSFSAQRMREAQARLKSPYLVLSGNHVKPAAAAAAAAAQTSARQQYG